ncbi:MAG: hypothetical protein US54_C0001G0048 [Candidatus Roizmanbacteria bacterium GW2011_GWA2_37_7]|uniref:Uncharacterized protein n=1 Tax=Candidatus Roizmanbacteria bacterium GW2011_GWA2_37_7 TaxID=1618481 RepID=A0A0G0H6M5_9BACT|nr:MAG: hypothetical protein US54_C0001G0048 [Candidatus Roizmanbacteria bacterium GW2011_GWA2_37_7]
MVFIIIPNFSMTTGQKPHFQRLKNIWIKRHQKIRKDLWKKHKQSLQWMRDNTKQLVVGSATGLLMLTHPANATTITQSLLPPTTPAEERPAHTKDELIRQLTSALPGIVQSLSDDQEKQIGHILTTFFHVPASTTIEGKKLNQNYGIIGAEQHLVRYPGDSMYTHFENDEEKKYWSSGMAPGRGAWGYFANSRSELTQQDILREKYYIAVQTFLSPGWNKNSNNLYHFFKFRKMLVVNPENGNAVIVVIGDAGPAQNTGKHLGGSPEVMTYLERQDGGSKGPVLYYFIDDPHDTIPLGPIYTE